MEKAYDLKALGAKLKEAGLVELEDGAEHIYKAIKEWLKESAQLSATPYDNIAIAYLDNLDRYVLPQLNKIDGEPS